MSILFVAAGGFIGSIMRFYISFIVNKRLIGTWTANITGSVLFAFLFHFYMTGMIPEWLWLFSGVGFCGSYTTFSTFGNETMQLILNKRYWHALLYVVASVFVTIVAVLTVLFIL